MSDRTQVSNDEQAIAVLAEILKVLLPLSEESRMRVIRRVAAFYA